MSKQFVILVFIFIFLFLGVKCDAQGQYSALITKMETSLFGIDYSAQSDEARLKRIEDAVYGEVSSNAVAQRVKKLSNDLSADLIGQEITPRKDTFAEDTDGYKESIPKPDSSVNYPIVNNLENKIFNKEFTNLDINQRLANLENNIFKKTYDDDLSSRVERLKLALTPEKVVDNSSDSSDDINMSDDIMSKLPSSQSNYYQSPGYNFNNSVLDDYESNPDITIPLAELERSTLKKSFPNDTPSNRLTRLELNIFKSTFPDDDEQTRLDRVSSARQAQKTSKRYDNNKFAQNMSTAMQLGAILLLVLAAVL